MLRARLLLIRLFARWLLPRGVWVGNHCGVYSLEWTPSLGELDSRGVMQGVTDERFRILAKKGRG